MEDSYYTRFLGSQINDSQVEYSSQIMDQQMLARMQFATYFNNEVLPNARARNIIFENGSQDTLSPLD